MEVLIIQKGVFEEMAAKFSCFTERMDAILPRRVEIVERVDGQSFRRAIPGV